jgi:hypothetical protein
VATVGSRPRDRDAAVSGHVATPDPFKHAAACKECGEPIAWSERLLAWHHDGRVMGHPAAPSTTRDVLPSWLGLLLLLIGAGSGFIAGFVVGQVVDAVRLVLGG